MTAHPVRCPGGVSGPWRAGVLSVPGWCACGSEFAPGELVLESLSFDVGVGDVPGEPLGVVPDP